jgi:hypothetical protein
MARFYGTVQGNRGEASRLGTTALMAKASGWHIGGIVYMGINSDGEDSAQLVLTSGSSFCLEGSHLVFFGSFTREDMLTLNKHETAFQLIIQQFLESCRKLDKEGA